MFEALKIYKNQNIKLETTYSALSELGYKRVSAVTCEGDFSVKGENLFIFPATFEYPIRIELFHNKVENINTVDTLSFKAISAHQMIIVLPFRGIICRRKYTLRNIHKETDPIDTFVDIEPGDYVVHLDYGIGRYLGTERIKTNVGLFDHLAVEYKGGDKVFVPFEDLNKIQKYIALQRRPPKLYKMGSRLWTRAKRHTERGVAKVAYEILEIQAKRNMLKGHKYSVDTDWQSRLEEIFPYKETKDQLKATIDVKRDMESFKPMDRLLCGDVGYGKTEVALRAAFKAVMDNKQVAILVPTTILAEQHDAVFTERMKEFPVAIGMLSRFKTRHEQKNVIKALREGKIDIIIGTHRLLSKDVCFKNLGLLIIDEEQRFGVKHKESLKRMRLVVDVLTLTATPIPRTLYLALMGGKDISSINTPPLERLPVKTDIVEFDDRIIQRAIRKEIKRKGQVFFIHNRIHGIEKICARLSRMMPEARIAVMHGRMHEKELERTMGEFIDGKIDVLVSTTIVESGIDIPNANTMFINRADAFGLADLYQLRGRVGRFNKRAFCYLIVRRPDTLTGIVQKRLFTIKKYQELGAGFKIAMQDLEIRGAGNLLGVEQHGFIAKVGFDLYCRLLRGAIEAFKRPKNLKCT